MRRVRKKELRTYRKGEIEELGQLALTLKSFRKYLLAEQSEDHYRRTAFKILDFKDKEIGQVEISVNFIRLLRSDLEADNEAKPKSEIPAGFLSSHKCKIRIISLGNLFKPTSCGAQTAKVSSG